MDAMNLFEAGTPATAPASVAEKKSIALALQGGGSYGAFTWGVLDALLATRRIDIAELSGTSAGALNAAIVASALARGNAGDARSALRSFWLSIARPALDDFGAVWGPVERQWRDTIGAWLVAGASPYATNPLGVNPLRSAIEAHVDIAALRGPDAPRLHVTITHVRTGRPRIVANDAISIDVLLASACLPQLFQAIEIDGEPYWDGGYCANPALAPLVNGRVRDVVVVQLAPDVVDDVPRGAAAIQRRIDEIVFHSSLVSELESIVAMRASAFDGGRNAPLAGLRLHRIGPPSAALLSEGSSLERSRAWIERLFRSGRGAARRFLARHGDEVGVRETLDLRRMLSGGAQRPAGNANAARNTVVST